MSDDYLVKWPWWKFRWLRMWSWAEEENAARVKAWRVALEESKIKGEPPPMPPDCVSIR